MSNSSQKQTGRSGPDLCVKCGHCNPVCPTYIEFANEGMSARGRLELASKFLSGVIDASDTLDRRFFTCLMCGACDNSCPRGISVTRAVYEARRKLALTWKNHRPYVAAIKYACNHPVASYRTLQFLDQTGLLSTFARFRPFSSIKELGLKLPGDRFKKNISVFRTPEPQGRVALFTGCAVDFLYPHMGAAFIQTLNAMNFEVVTSKSETCCGAPLLSMGLRDEAARLAEKNLAVFGRLKVDAVISLCPTCTHFIKDVYTDLIGEGIMNATDISKFIRKSSLTHYLKPYLSKSVKIMYHDPCHSINYLNVVEEPRKILRALGAKLEEPSEKSCCGIGGGVGLLNNDVSEILCKNRASAFESADMIVTSCPNCILQLGHMIKDKPIKHIIELIPEGIRKKRG
jgi:glycolate oxidase iron-sulfur subunit